MQISVGGVVEQCGASVGVEPGAGEREIAHDGQCVTPGLASELHRLPARREPRGEIDVGPEERQRDQHRYRTDDPDPRSGAALPAGGRRSRGSDRQRETGDARAGLRQGKRRSHDHDGEGGKLQPPAFGRREPQEPVAPARSHSGRARFGQADQVADSERQRHQHPARVVILVHERAERRRELVARSPDPVDLHAHPRVVAEHRLLHDADHRDQDAETHERRHYAADAVTPEVAVQANQEDREAHEQRDGPGRRRRVHRQRTARHGRRIPPAPATPRRQRMARRCCGGTLRSRG